MLIIILLASSLHARGVYQTDKDFLDEVYDNAPPKSKSMMLVGSLRKSVEKILDHPYGCLLYTSPSPRDGLLSRMPSSA